MEDIETVNSCLPDFAGFVFAAGSKRYVSFLQAKQLKAALHPDICAVGVFVNAPVLKAAFLANEGIIDMIQLHGDENTYYIEALKRLTDKPVIKAVRVTSSEQILKAEALPCDYLLLDAYDQKRYGGTGKSFDTALIPKLHKPYFLAGGIGGENALEVIRRCAPYSLDVSSKAETDGKKDAEKVRRLVQLAHKTCAE